MTLLQPIWLLLAIPLGMALWHWRLPSRLLTVMRLMVLVLLLLAISGLALMSPSRAGTVVILADRSLSMPADKDEHHKLAIDLVKSAMDPGEHLAVVAFGQRAVSERLPQVGKFSGFVNEFSEVLDVNGKRTGQEHCPFLVPDRALDPLSRPAD